MKGVTGRRGPALAQLVAGALARSGLAAGEGGQRAGGGFERQAVRESSYPTRQARATAAARTRQMRLQRV